MLIFASKLLAGHYLDVQDIIIMQVRGFVHAVQVLPNEHVQEARMLMAEVKPGAFSEEERTVQMANLLKSLIREILVEGKKFEQMSVRILCRGLLKLRLRLSVACQYKAQLDVLNWVTTDPVLVCESLVNLEATNDKERVAKLHLQNARVAETGRLAEIARQEAYEVQLKRELRELELARERMEDGTDTSLSSFDEIHTEFPDNAEARRKEDFRKRTLRSADATNTIEFRKEVVGAAGSTIERYRGAMVPSYVLSSSSSSGGSVAMELSDAQPLELAQSAVVDSSALCSPDIGLDPSQDVDVGPALKQELLPVDDKLEVMRSSSAVLNESQLANPPSFNRQSLTDQVDDQSSLELILEPTQSDLEF